MTQLLNNRYQILGTLGQGGFGETFLAIDTHMPSARKCVIKCLQPMLRSPDTPEWLKERFQREAAILEELGDKSRQIPKLYAYFSENNQFYLVQEWIEGQTLTQIQTEQGNLPEAEVQRILVSLLLVLEFIHDHRLIHRDIKPDNIIIRSSDRLPFLIDFGVIKETMATIVNPNGKTAYSIALGTPGYMASEQAAGRPVYSSDLYSLGLTAIFSLTGKSPQYLESDPHTGEIQWRAQAPQIHSTLATVLDRALRFHPRDRFPTAKAMLTALNASSFSGSPTIVVRPLSRSHQPPRSPRSSVNPPSSSRTERIKPDASAIPPDSELSWQQWIGLSILAFGLTTAAFVGGFFLISSRHRPHPTPSPVFQDTEPQPPPNQSFSTPSPRPTFRSRPRPQPSVQVNPTPEPTIEPSPEPTPTPEPTPSVLETPSPATSPEPTIVPIPLPPPATDATPPLQQPPQPQIQAPSQSGSEPTSEGIKNSIPSSNASNNGSTNGIAPPQPKQAIPSN